MNVQVVQCDLLDQPVDVIVNAWNRNIIPWWLLLPQGVSGAIKRRGGTGPFKELAKHGPIPLGGAVLTSAGRLPFKAIIHVAGINMLWRASEWSIRQSVRNAMALAHENGFQSIAFPLIGAGSGGFNQERARAVMEDELGKIDSPMEVRLVVFQKRAKPSNSPSAWTAEEVVRYYREMGFLGDGDLAECTSRLLTRFEEDHGTPFNPADPWNDVWLLSYDEQRVWTGDPECDVCAENEVYTEVLAEWAKISDGVFSPTEIEEVWEDEEGPISVHFTLDGQRRTLHPTWDNDWLDLDILASINRIIGKSGKEFVCASDVNFAVVFVLDAGSKRRLATERQLPFITLEAPPVAER
jgi:O-acetyl-ADP-ribose deacetylase (regulator of RNase III)